MWLFHELGALGETEPKGLTSLPGSNQSQVTKKRARAESLTRHEDRSGIVYLEDQGKRSSSMLIRSGSTGEGGWPELDRLDKQMKSTASRAR